ncbi:MAG: hypothetical protein U0531_15960 [Dehalococcoidia bacterium]
MFIGQHPNSEWLGGMLPLDAGGHLPVSLLWMETSIPGLFAAGDIRIDSARQVAAAWATAPPPPFAPTTT